VFIEFNRAAERIEKIPREDVIGKNVCDVFPGVKEFGLLEVMKRVWKTGKPEHHPIAFYEDDRISGWRENFAYRLPSGDVAIVYSDETERKQAVSVRPTHLLWPEFLCYGHPECYQ
jgi:PAS domain-containing protein